ncbi:hypothetical protein O3P69_017369 [Scylla paramamosain]|uniref:Hcy-binding domain-containing protein n=1 Tax=Scylla paramamosain TaxID=85552 RepID=A0AAW0SDN2_SCYPA
MLGSHYTVVDGGLASTLQAEGYEVDGDPLWSARLLATHPSAIKKVVAGSVGPYGACQADGSEYTGSYIPSVTQCDLATWHLPRLEALAGAGLQLVALETLPALSEALALLGLLQEFPDLNAWVTFSCKDAQHTSYGDNFGEAVRSCYEQGREQLIGVGVNCTPPPPHHPTSSGG